MEEEREKGEVVDIFREALNPVLGSHGGLIMKNMDTGWTMKMDT